MWSNDKGYIKNGKLMSKVEQTCALLVTPLMKLITGYTNLVCEVRIRDEQTIQHFHYIYRAIILFLNVNKHYEVWGVPQS